MLIKTWATKFVVEEFYLCISKKVILTDSECVLHWIKRDKRLSVFEWMKSNYWKMSILVSFPPNITLQILWLEDLQFQKSSYDGMAHPGCSLMKEIEFTWYYIRWYWANVSAGKEWRWCLFWDRKCIKDLQMCFKQLQSNNKMVCRSNLAWHQMNWKYWLAIDNFWMLICQKIISIPSCYHGENILLDWWLKRYMIDWYMRASPTHFLLYNRSIGYVPQGAPGMGEKSFLVNIF